MGGSNILIDLIVTVTIENLARRSFWLVEELICGKPKLSCLLSHIKFRSLEVHVHDFLVAEKGIKCLTY